MVARGKAAHTILFYGEKGSGRKTMAEYYCRILLCSNTIHGKPCNECKSCHNIDNGIHPDIHFAEKSGKLGGYSVETAKHICSEAYIKPNNGDRKVYIFSDCRKMDVRTQNTLLKIIEEPPPHVHFIFTSEEKGEFLPTIISRCVSLGVSSCTSDECRAALSEQGYQNHIDDAIGCFHGNIGMCIEYLTDDSVKKYIELTKLLTDSIINRDEYHLASYLCETGKERGEIRIILSLLDKQVRDAAVLAGGAETEGIGCYKDGAEKLSHCITASQAVRVHGAIDRAWKSIEANANSVLVMTALCSEISRICGARI